MAGAGAVLADAAQLAHEHAELPDALDEMAVRADLIGAGPILDTWAKRRVRMMRRRRRWAQVWARR